MASIIKVETLQDTAGNNAVDMQYVSSGSAKAWIFTTDKTSYVPTGSFNVSSMTDNNTGRPETNFTNSFNDTNIVAGFDGGYNRLVGSYTSDGGITTSTFAHYLISTGGSNADVATTGVGFGASYLGDLA